MTSRQNSGQLYVQARDLHEFLNLSHYFPDGGSF